MERQIDKYTVRQRDRLINRQLDKQIDRKIGRQIELDKQIDKQTVRQTDRQTVRQTDRQIMFEQIYFLSFICILAYIKIFGFSERNVCTLDKVNIDRQHGFCNRMKWHQHLMSKFSSFMII